MSQLRVPHTRMNLLRFRRSLKIAESGREILEKKRDILMMELRNFVYDMERCREEFNEGLKDALLYPEKAAVTLGPENVENKAESATVSVDFSIDYRSIMGIVVPIIKVRDDFPQPDYGFVGSNIFLDTAFKKFHDILEVLGKLIELQETVYRMSHAVEATQRRVNGLKQIHIPRYRRIVKEIELDLEEKEREEFVRMKRIKKTHQREKHL